MATSSSAHKADNDVVTPCGVPCSAVMLREGRLPARSFQRLVSGEQQQLAGYVMGELACLHRTRAAISGFLLLRGARVGPSAHANLGPS